jgi:hypothetical protein
MKIKLPRHAAYAAAIIAATTLIVISSTPTTLQFLGVSTVFGLSKHDKSGLLRQADCSITRIHKIQSGQVMRDALASDA